MNNANESKEWQLLEKMLLSTITEQRRARRWKIVYRLFILMALVFIVYTSITVDPTDISIPHGKHTALVEISGVIEDDGEVDAEDVVSSLKKAFENKGAEAIVLKINSPGGSAVNADYVFAEIKRLQQLHPKKVYAVITDIGASGGYYIAAAADEIYANPASIVGSIGVRLGEGFGFEKLMDKLGVERRMYTAGEHKALLDPFSPIKPEEVSHVKNMLKGVHEQFIARVKQGRGERLKNDPDIFSGLFWNGVDAKALGLIDGFASVSEIARDKVKQEEVVDYTIQLSQAERFFERVGVVIGKTLVSSLSKSGLMGVNTQSL